MTRGLYAAAGGMLAGLLKHEVMANNLANAGTPGFKAERLSFGSFQRVPVPGIQGDQGTAQLFMSSTVSRPQVDLTPGPLTTTGNDLDLAIEDDAWFVVATAAGERYTRGGRFQLAADGELRTADGMPVLGEAGPLVIPRSAKVTVLPDGQVLADGTAVDRLRLVTFTEPESLVHVGHALVGGGAPRPADGIVRQGMIEESNAEISRQLVEMMAVMRAYELNQRVIRAQDETLEQAIQVARS